MAEETLKQITLSIPFESPAHANLTYEILNVDQELKGSRVHREMTTTEAVLFIKFRGADLKKLRVAVNAVLRNTFLIVKTISEFGID